MGIIKLFVQEHISSSVYPKDDVLLVFTTSFLFLFPRKRDHRLPRVPDNDGEEDEGHRQ